MKSKFQIFILKILLVCLANIILKNNNLFSQSEQQASNDIFLKNIKEKVFRIKGHDDIYYDLNRKSITKLHDYFDNKSHEEFFELEYIFREGSFLNKNKKEYLFVINLPADQICSFFSHSENYGNTTLIYIFDENYDQITDVFFQDSRTKLVEISDIDQDGINESIFESSYGQQGCSESWLMFFYKNFTSPILRIINYHNCEDAGFSGEIIVLNSTYTIFDKTIIFNSTLNYYLKSGFDKNYQADNRYMKTEYRQDEYKYKEGIFTHIKDKNNVDWDDERLSF